MIISQLKINISDLKNVNRSGKVNEEEIFLIKNKLYKDYNIQKKDIDKIIVLKKSVDARKNHKLSYIYNLNVVLFSEKICSSSNVCFNPVVNPDTELMNDKKIIITGAGPAGLFCAYVLAINGLKPVIIEQGASMHERIKQVQAFWNNHEKLNEYSNVCFGEGGAGTFSDGKLNTSIKDKTGRFSFIKKIFVENGAPEEILYLDKPHIGTDILREVIVNIRNKIIQMGGKVMFNTHLDDIMFNNGKIFGISIISTVNGKKKIMPCDRLVLAIGHSSGKTYRMLNRYISLSCKDFAVGLRVHHLQNMIDKCQYGKDYYKIPPADYKLRYHTDSERAVYSFCMCPGGYVVNSSSEKGKTLVNGMSDYKRDSKFANSAIVVNVCAGKDYDDSDPLGGVKFQEKIETSAYKHADGKIPVQTYYDFKNDIDPTYPEEFIKDNSSIKGEFAPSNIRKIIPEFISESIVEAMDYYNKIIPGYGDNDVIMCGVETRTSSPVRINRDESFQSDGGYIYPCGEGAGYAGGIISAASDGIKIALAITDSLIL